MTFPAEVACGIEGRPSRETGWIWCVPGTKSTVIASSSPGTESVALSPVARTSSSRWGRATARTSSRARMRVREVHDAQAEAIATGRGHALDEPGRRERARAAGTPCSASFPCAVRSRSSRARRRRQACRGRRSPSRLRRSGASTVDGCEPFGVRSVADPGTQLVPVQFHHLRRRRCPSSCHAPTAGRGPWTSSPTSARSRGGPGSSPTLRELTDYVYFRDNVAGEQREWWQHRQGCGEWFLAQRDTRTNEVLSVTLPGHGRTVRLPASARRAARPERDAPLPARRVRGSRASAATRSGPRSSRPDAGSSPAPSSTTGLADCSAARATARTA